VFRELAYEALAYVWQQHAEQMFREVMIDLVGCPIPLNLVEFLQQRRSRSQKVVLWIDSFRINQLDEYEKMDCLGSRHC
jgi:hypothetical protein